jgi:general secretion pathway protein I
MRRQPARGRRAFSLLEVMMAVAILGGALTAILSAQASIAASNKLGNNIGTALSLGRCRMTEVEEKLLKYGYPDMEDVQTESPCCNDELTTGFTCESRVERVLMPTPPAMMNTSIDGGMSLSGSPSALMSGLLPQASPSSLSGALAPAAGNLGGLSQSMTGDGGFATLNLEAGVQSMGASLTQQMGGGGLGTQGLLSMVMGFVYPFIKPMMEASIRKLTVVVRWKEGGTVKEFILLQYVTNPSSGGFAAASASAAASGGATPGNPAAATPATPALPAGH